MANDLITDVTIGTDWTSIDLAGGGRCSVFNASDEDIEIRFDPTASTYTIPAGEGLRDVPNNVSCDGRCASGGKVLQVLRAIAPFRPGAGGGGPVGAHALGGASHTADTLANLVALLSDAEGLAALEAAGRIIQSALTSHEPLTYDPGGTVSVSAGTPDVVGVGTSFTWKLAEGQQVSIAGEQFGILSIADDTHLTLDGNHVAGASGVPILRGDGNVRLGPGASETTTGWGSTAIGHRAGANRPGNLLTAVGSEALMSAVGADECTAVGIQALRNLVSGNANTALGAWAGWALVDGYQNIIIGDGALMNGQNGAYNVAVGMYAAENTNAQYNTAIGDRALRKNTSGVGNYALGVEALHELLTGNYNLALGYHAGRPWLGSDAFFVAKGPAAADNLLVGDFATGRLGLGGLLDPTAIDPSALFDLQSTSLGFLPPRMTETERDAIASPAEGLMVYNTDTETYDLYDGSEWQPMMRAADQTGDLTWQEAPAYNGEIFWLGWHIQTATAAALASGTPVDMGEEAFHSHIVVDVSAASGAPFTIRLTGMSVDEATGATTAGDTEDLAVTGNGYYQSAKSWIDEVQLSIVEGGKSCTVDIYRTTYWDFQNTQFKITGIRIEWMPDRNNWDLECAFYHVQNDGSLVTIDSVDYSSGDATPRAWNNRPGKYKVAVDHTIDGSQNEGLIIHIKNQNRCGEIMIQVKYEIA